MACWTRGQFEAYADPVRKKSYFLLQLLRSECGWQYADSRELGAPVDYHEVRGHLRLGTVVVQDERLLASIAAGEPVGEEDDLAIRRAVHEAIVTIAGAATDGDSPALHYFFWNLFRACCPREGQHCFACGPVCKLPSRYRLTADHCSLASVCRSRGQISKLMEHVTETEYY